MQVRHMTASVAPGYIYQQPPPPPHSHAYVYKVNLCLDDSGDILRVIKTLIQSKIYFKQALHELGQWGLKLLSI